MNDRLGWSIVAVIAMFASACSQQQATGQARPAGSGSVGKPAVVSADDYSPSRFGDSAHVNHRWFPMRPGHRLDFRGSSFEDGERLNHGVTIIVTDLTKVIDGVENIVVWERDYTEGELVETELALFAQDDDGHIWHMGEYPEEWEDGEFVTAPAWVHGIEGATAGITIHAQPTEGTPDYAQGFAPPPIAWVDRGRVHKTNQKTCVPEGCYADVVVIEEFEQTIPNAFQDKYYAPGVGVVRVGWRGRNDESKEVLELVDFRALAAEEMADVRRDSLALEERAYRISGAWAKTEPSKGPTG